MSELLKTSSEIKDWLRKIGIKNKFSLSVDLVISVKGDVLLTKASVVDGKLPVRFGMVVGNFDCGSCKLTCLDGCPSYITGNFNCDRNYLTSLVGCTKEIGGSFSCVKNQLTDLVGCPNRVTNNFLCNDNELLSLLGVPAKIDGDFDCSGNQLTSLEGGPVEVGRNYCCNLNKLTSLSCGDVKVGSQFDCCNNKLQSLEGCPLEASLIYYADNCLEIEDGLSFVQIKAYVENKRVSDLLHEKLDEEKIISNMVKKSKI